MGRRTTRCTWPGPNWARSHQETPDHFMDRSFLQYHLQDTHNRSCQVSRHFAYVRTRPARCARSPFATMKKMPSFCILLYTRAEFPPGLQAVSAGTSGSPPGRKQRKGSNKRLTFGDGPLSAEGTLAAAGRDTVLHTNHNIEIFFN